ncbi:MAG: aspartate-semialdehyde dehydrogenase [Ignavibacteriales bacterium]|nr:aspartate-semialdehyde dehydrogenase [Ignavibacteriales bacterium]
MRLHDVAVVGATGLVGRAMVRVLEERKFPVNRLVLLASERSVGKEISFNGKNVPVHKLEPDRFKHIEFALFSAGAAISKEFAPEAVKHGAVVIDNSSAFRMDERVPLVVPEVNRKQVFKHKGIIANPNCSTIQMVVVLKPLHDQFKIKRVVVSTYQSVTGAGNKAVAQLEDELANRPPREKKFPYQIAFNCLPHIDVFFDDGYTKEEVKMMKETAKIMGEHIKVTATTVRVPVIGGHSESVNIEFEKKCSAEDVRAILSKAPGIVVQDDPKHNLYPMPITSYEKDEVFVGRIRKDDTVPNGINLWIVSDNIRKGAATNAVQIAEVLAAGK